MLRYHVSVVVATFRDVQVVRERSNYTPFAVRMYLCTIQEHGVIFVQKLRNLSPVIDETHRFRFDGVDQLRVFEVVFEQRLNISLFVDGEDEAQIAKRRNTVYHFFALITGGQRQSEHRQHPATSEDLGCKGTSDPCQMVLQIKDVPLARAQEDDDAVDVEPLFAHFCGVVPKQLINAVHGVGLVFRYFILQLVGYEVVGAFQCPSRTGRIKSDVVTARQVVPLQSLAIIVCNTIISLIISYRVVLIEVVEAEGVLRGYLGQQ